MVALAAGMLYNVQVSDAENGSNISLAALANVAVAQGGENGGDEGSQCAYRNETWTEVYGQTVKVCVF